MANLPGMTLRVDSDKPRTLQEVLAREPHVLGVAQIGASLRVLTDRKEDGDDWLRDRLKKAGVEAKVEPTEANLEDVFVAVTRDRKEDGQ